MFRILEYIVVIYLAYQFIFHFIIPVFKTTQHVKKNIRNMQDQARNAAQQNQGTGQAADSGQPAHKTNAEDYIEFEEIK